ncbi:MAG: M28 family peptidase [Candidatus Rokubacteria bacterium]|nr:M28 family peptidase [Candidatus Rokubacteria bacterium]
MGLREVGFYLRGRVNNGVARLLNARRAAPVVPLSLEDLLRQPRLSLLDRVRLFEGRDNAERQAMVARYLAARDLPFARHLYATFEGSGESFAVEVGAGEATLILIGHHDAVPGSPGANDNASAVAILMVLAERLLQDPPRRIRARPLFTGGEEVGYLGARCYVKTAALDGVVGVLSLELCGIGDALVVWDVAEPFDRAPLVQAFAGTLEGLGYRRDESYHLVGRIPVFGSDHRAFWEKGIPAFGLTVVPRAEAEPLRQFVLNPWRGAFRQLVRRPPPFHTYHTAGDRSETLEPGALELTTEALFALVHSL